MKPSSKAILIGLDAVVASMIEKYLETGMMPNLSTLIQRGAYTRVRAVFPGVTPINWATISTGAYPGTHGITDFSIIEPGDPLNGGRDGFISSSYQAETLWQAACRENLRAATLNFPGAEASYHANHLWIAGRGSPAAKTDFAVSNTSCLATNPYYSELRDSVKVEVKGSSSKVILFPEYKEGEGLELRLEVSQFPPGVRVCDSDGIELVFLKFKKTSQWLWGNFSMDKKIKRCSYRLQLTHFNPERQAFAIYVSQITSPSDISSQPLLSEALVKQIGPFIGYCGARGVDRGWCSPEDMVEEGRYKGLWFSKAASILITKYDYDLVMFKWHLLDHIQHSFWGGMDPISPWYEPKFERIFSSLISDSYKAADLMIGELLPLLDDDTTLVVVSDHGHLPHMKAIAINNLLAQNGLISIKPGTENPPEIDWVGTRAYGGPALGHIWINRKGQRPDGIVTDEEYEPLRTKVINLLLNLRDPQNGIHPVAKVLRREDAKPLGLWGNRVGDIVYLMTPGYSGDFNWSPLSRNGNVIVPLGPGLNSTAEYGERKFIANKFQSVHGCGDPSANLGLGTEETILAMAGPHIRAGLKVNSVPDLTVTTPTLCLATGLPLPNKSEGEILDHWIKD